MTTLPDLEPLEALARAYDREDASQRGEPDPWKDAEDDAELVSERLSCAQVAEAAYLAARSAPEAGKAVDISVQTMRLSDGRSDYFVAFKCADREVTPHVFRERYKAEYHVALYKWLFGQEAEEPSAVEFNADDWPALASVPAEPVACERPILFMDEKGNITTTDGQPREWLIRKGCCFYRPNKAGYTTVKAEAGRYTELDARLEAEIEPWHMSAIHQDDWADPVNHDTTRIAELEAELSRSREAEKRLGEALEPFAEACGHFDSYVQDDDTVDVALRHIRARHLRAARSALATVEGRET